ncbi:MAG: hypothetical protein PWQ56_344 [Patescibacteria group bacterium]|nr:hypothetical protein [Patescibacteria group bacterium]
MIMKNKVILATLLLIAFLSFVFFHFFKEDNDSKSEIITEEDVILFYGDGCPACSALDQLMQEKGISEIYNHKEVYYNQENSNQLITKAKECGIDANLITIPFLYADGNCYTGVGPIINYFEEKTYD